MSNADNLAPVYGLLLLNEAEREAAEEGIRKLEDSGLASAAAILRSALSVSTAATAEPHYVLRYDEYHRGPPGNVYAPVSVRDWNAGLSRAVSNQVCDRDGQPLVVYMAPVIEAKPVLSEARKRSSISKMVHMFDREVVKLGTNGRMSLGLHVHAVLDEMLALVAPSCTLVANVARTPSYNPFINLPPNEMVNRAAQLMAKATAPSVEHGSVEMPESPLLADSTPKKTPTCGCRRCLEESKAEVNDWPITLTMMVLCPTCGNKRCPRAADHRYICTNSNEPGQVGRTEPVTGPQPTYKPEAVHAPDETLIGRVIAMLPNSKSNKDVP